MDKPLRNKTALISGAGKTTGIGYAIAKKLASMGANVIIADLGVNSAPNGGIPTGTQDEMRQIVEKIQQTYDVNAMAFNVDVTNNETISGMISSLTRQGTHIDILCNNAGASFGVPDTVQNYDESAWMKTIDVNLHGVFRMTRAVLPLMSGKPGSIVNTASRAGKVPALFNGAYSVAKAGVIMLTKVLALELAGTHIRVNAVCPGQIMTDLEKWRFELEAKFFNSTPEEREEEMKKSIPLNRIGSIADVADLVAFLASDESAYITGQAINVCGGQLMEL